MTIEFLKYFSENYSQKMSSIFLEKYYIVENFDQTVIRLHGGGFGTMEDSIESGEGRRHRGHRQKNAGR